MKLVQYAPPAAFARLACRRCRSETLHHKHHCVHCVVMHSPALVELGTPPQWRRFKLRGSNPQP